ncbi:DNA-directed RNA polymerase I subunit RPA12-like isoform X2 [Carassius gibelio]|uniref:DNA-directed RNA polymerase I subunit RPA12-like isoform X2 n=1 Tax=Carassius gibelio TaxID=101364 RepID=UPI002279A666|nr:DNA-directed RNA polymerase I subunit RPA12-like isoform X2 [Carassius gibelio]
MWEYSSSAWKGKHYYLPAVLFQNPCSRTLSEFTGQVIKSSVVFNPLDQSSSTVDSGEDAELKGPVIDRRCSRCNKEGMVYHTRQMRSADEGQTVFFTCIHCRFQEKEDS